MRMMIDSRYALVPAGAMHAEPAPAAVIDLRGIGSALRRRWHWVAVPALFAAGIALAATLALGSRYDANAKVLLDPRGLQVLQNDLRPQATTGEEIGAEVDSQVQVIASTDLLGKVAAQLDLAGDPEFNDPVGGVIARAVTSLKGLFGSAPPATADGPAQRVLRVLQNAVAVRRAEKTYVLDITVRTRDAAKSARIANAVADAYLKEAGDVRAEAVRRSGADLSVRLEELRKRAQRSDAAVEAYRKSSDLVAANGRLVSDQQLADLATQLTLARTRTADQDARVGEIRRLVKKGNPAEAMSEVTNSPTIAALRTQYADATRVEAEALLAYGPRHPAMMAAAQQVQNARKRINEEVSRLARAAETDLERARAAETSLTQRLDALKRESSAYAGAQVRLRELERQATADRTVYENFLNRAKDLQERQTVDTGTARVISRATAPDGRAGLSRVLVVAGGLLFGAAMGLGLALLREQFDGTVRSAGQVAAATRLPVFVLGPGGLPREAALRRVRGSLTPMSRGGPARIVVVAGLGAAPARVNLARHLAQTVQDEGERTILVDGDLDARGLTRTLRAEGSPGLTEALAAPETAASPRSFDGLPVVTAGRLAAGTVPTSVHALRAVLDPFRRQAGLVVIDGGPVGANLRAFAALADDIIFVVEGGRVALQDLQDALDLIGPDIDCVRGIVLAGQVEA